MRDLLFGFDYRGTLLQVGEEGRLVGNVFTVSVQPRFSLLGNERGALELRIPLALGLLLQPYAPTSNMLVFNLSLALRDNFLYHVFNWKAAEHTFLAVGLAVEFSLESSNFSAQSFEVALLQKIGNLTLGPAYFFQNQRWDNTNHDIHHLLLRLEYRLRSWSTQP